MSKMSKRYHDDETCDYLKIHVEVIALISYILQISQLIMLFWIHY